MWERIAENGKYSLLKMYRQVIRQLLNHLNQKRYVKLSRHDGFSRWLSRNLNNYFVYLNNNHNYIFYIMLTVFHFFFILKCLKSLCLKLFQGRTQGGWFEPRNF